MSEPINIFDTAAYYYNLPEELIAQTPVEPRDSSRLMYYNRGTGELRHLKFRDIAEILMPGDVLVINDTKVIPARLFAYNEKGREFEVLLLKRLNYKRWECLIKPAKKLKIGGELVVNEELKLRAVAVHPEDGVREVEFEFEGVFEDILSRVGNVPLPPYITEKLDDPTRYQTVYANEPGSAAAPTAGLHFTPELMRKLQDKGIEFVKVLLHVGLGTFRPVKTHNILEHKMHTEYYRVTEEAADKINKALSEGRRVIAVGTTSVRTLESAAKNGRVEAGEGNTSIFIYPGYEFQIVKGLITNFHLPESTLIMLVSAFMGREKTLELYNIAVREQYRFFSFGDAMFVL